MSFYGYTRATNIAAGGANTAIKATPGRLMGVLLSGLGAEVPTLTIHNNASAASGAVLLTAKAVGNTPHYIDLSGNGAGVDASLGIFVSSTSWTNFTATVYWA